MFIGQVGETIGYGAVATALVVALGYMIRDRRDSDKRVDEAVGRLIANEQKRADRAEKARGIAYDARDRAVAERDDERAAHEQTRLELERCLERERTHDGRD